MFLIIFVGATGCCSPEKATNRNPKQQQKCLDRKDKKKNKAAEKATKKAIKEHLKIQSKSTRKQMKRTKRKSNRYNTDKRKFFLFRWLENIRD